MGRFVYQLCYLYIIGVQVQGKVALACVASGLPQVVLKLIGKDFEPKICWIMPFVSIVDQGPRAIPLFRFN